MIHTAHLTFFSIFMYISERNLRWSWGALNDLSMQNVRESWLSPRFLPPSQLLLPPPLQTGGQHCQDHSSRPPRCVSSLWGVLEASGASASGDHRAGSHNYLCLLSPDKEMRAKRVGATWRSSRTVWQEGRILSEADIRHGLYAILTLVLI